FLSSSCSVDRGDVHCGRRRKDPKRHSRTATASSFSERGAGRGTSLVVAAPLHPFGNGSRHPPAPIVPLAGACDGDQERRSVPTRTFTERSMTLVSLG